MMLASSRIRGVGLGCGEGALEFALLWYGGFVAWGACCGGACCGVGGEGAG